MKQLVSIFSVLAIATVASANGEVKSYKEIFTCFNRAQMTDAPMISIAVDKSGKQFIHSQTRGSNTFTQLTQIFGMGLFDNSNFEANGVSVLEIAGIENPPKRATVTLKGLGLVYQCTPTMN